MNGKGGGVAMGIGGGVARGSGERGGFWRLRGRKI